MKNIPLIIVLVLSLASCQNKDGLEGKGSDESLDAMQDMAMQEEIVFAAEADASNEITWGTTNANAAMNGGFALADNNQNSTKFSFEDGTTNTALSLDNPSNSQKIIRNAYIGLELEDYEAEKQKILNRAQRFEAYVFNEHETVDYSKISNKITLKIPSKYFDDFINGLDGDFASFDYKRITTQDVGEEFFDLKARLKTKKEMEVRYISFLKRAKNIEELLQIEGQIRRIREEIEAKEGRLKFLSSRVSLSTIQLNIYQNYDFDKPTKKSSGFGGKMLDALNSGWRSILMLLVGIAYGWPYVLVIGLILYFAIKRLVKQRL
jgi:hypothetical protein